MVHLLLEFKVIAARATALVGFGRYINPKSQKVFVVEFKRCQIINGSLFANFNELENLSLLKNV